MRRILTAAGWHARERNVVRPLITISLWGDAALVIAVGDRAEGEDALAQLEGLCRAGYEGPFVLLAPAPSTYVRRRAFAQGACDVIGLPVNGHHLEARLRAVLRTLRLDMTPSVP